MNEDLLGLLPFHLRYEIIEDITAKTNPQSVLAKRQLAVKKILEKDTAQGKRSDLIPNETCTPDGVQVKKRRQSTIEKVAALFSECGGAVRRRIYVYEHAQGDPLKYGKYLAQMDKDDSPYEAYAALKAAQRAEAFANEPVLARYSSRVRRGDLWELGHHRILCGDSTSSADVACLLDGATPHLMVTDPPYGVSYQPSWRGKIGNKNPNKTGLVANDDRYDWSEVWALFPGDVCYVWFSGLRAGDVQISLEKHEFIPRMLITWDKSRPVISRGHYNWQTEFCFYAVRNGKSAHWNVPESQSNLWKINNSDDRGHGHGTQKPVECMLRPIENNSKPGDAVYDPFVGSGTTIIACEASGRRCYAMDIDPDYCAVAIERWQTFSGEQAIHATTGQFYADVIRERGGEKGDAYADAEAKVAS
jgi:DNA modification methylase